MTAFAMVVVVEAPDEETAYDAVSRAQRAASGVSCMFVGDPWPVAARGTEDLFDTASCIAQR